MWVCFDSLKLKNFKNYIVLDPGTHWVRFDRKPDWEVGEVRSGYQDRVGSETTLPITM